MRTGPMFTLGVPTWNRADHLRRAIGSCLSQTESSFELIVSDNASTDESPAVAADFDDPRLRYVRHPENQGSFKNAQFLLEQARGTFFVLHQDDDLLHPEFLERCAIAVKQDTDAAIYASAVISGPEPKGLLGEDLVLRDPPWVPVMHMPPCVARIDGVDAAIMQCFSLPFVSPGVAMRTQTMRETGGFFGDFGWAGDNITLARIGLRGSVLYDPRPGAFLRFHGGNYSSTIPSRMRFAYRRAANRIIVEALNGVDPEWPRRARELFAHLPRKRLWKFLSTAWEGDYPPVLRDAIADVLDQGSTGPRWLTHAQAAVIRGRFHRVVRSRLRPERI